jgi:flagellar hook-associated protein 3 FlgL
VTQRITSSMLSRRILDDVALASHRVSRLQQKLSSGKELHRPSDDPTAVTRALALRADLEGVAQHRKNVGEALGWSDVTDSALDSIGDALQRVRELVVAAASDTGGPDARRAVAQEVRGLIDTIKEAGNASYGGRFVFAGTETATRPYTPGAADGNAGNGDRITREIGPGITADVNVVNVLGTGTGGDTNVLVHLRKIVADLEGDDGTALRGDLSALDGHLQTLNATRAAVGATVNRLEAAADRLGQYEGSANKLLSETEDVDVAKAMVEFSIQQAALQSALRAGSQIVQNSLLDFLR